MSQSSIFELKDKIQRDALNKWYLKGCVGTVQLCTGLGKSRLGVLASEYVAKITNYDCKILIVTPTQEIRDNAWVEEFAKWNAELVLQRCIKIMCIQSACRLMGEHWDMIIADESHHYFEDYPNDKETDSVYMKLFFNNTYNRLLSLSAYIPPKKRHWAFKIAPLITSINTREAVELGLVSPFIIYNLSIPITKEEQTLLSYIEDRIDYLNEKGYSTWTLISKRKMLLSKLKSRRIVAKQISDYFGDKRGILFSQYIDDVIELQKDVGSSGVSIHSKIKSKLRKQNLIDFNTKKYSRIISAKALNEGVNLTDVDFAIMLSANSSIKDFTQCLGRIIRFSDNKKAILIRLYLKNSRDSYWMHMSQSEHEVVFVDSIPELFAKIEQYESENII